MPRIERTLKPWSVDREYMVRCVVTYVKSISCFCCCLAFAGVPTQQCQKKECHRQFCSLHLLHSISFVTTFVLFSIACPSLPHSLSLSRCAEIPTWGLFCYCPLARVVCICVPYSIQIDRCVYCVRWIYCN